MATYTPQKWKKEDSERLRGEGDQIKFIDLRSERWLVVRFRKARRVVVQCVDTGLTSSNPARFKMKCIDEEGKGKQLHKNYLLLIRTRNS